MRVLRQFQPHSRTFDAFFNNFCDKAEAVMAGVWDWRRKDRHFGKSPLRSQAGRDPPALCKTPARRGNS